MHILKLKYEQLCIQQRKDKSKETENDDALQYS